MNVYAPNNKASKYMEQKLTKLERETDKSTVIVGEMEKERNTKSQRDGDTEGR